MPDIRFSATSDLANSIEDYRLSRSLGSTASAVHEILQIGLLKNKLGVDHTATNIDSQLTLTADDFTLIQSFRRLSDADRRFVLDYLNRRL